MFATFKYLAVALGLLSTLAFTSPIDTSSVEEPNLFKRLPLVNCNEDQTKRLESVFEQLSGYSLLPVSWLSDTSEGFPYDEKKKS